MSTSYDIEICDHCGTEFEVGYWRRDLSLCEDCLSLAGELTKAVSATDTEVDEFDADDWAPVELYGVEELEFETTITGY